MAVQLKRVYLKPAKSDGCRILVDRLWPRGLSKQKAKVDHWLRDIAPSTGLRKWYGHDPERWTEFQRRYIDELKHNAEVWKPISKAAHGHRVTLVFGWKDMEHNNAVVLQRFLSTHGKTARSRS